MGLAVLVGCGAPEELDEVPEPVERSRVLVESHLPSIDEVMVEAARKKSIRRAVEHRIEEEAERPFADRVEDGLRYSTVFRREYIEGDVDVSFADEAGINERGEQVLAVIGDAWRHGIEVETFHEEEIESLNQRLLKMDPAQPVDNGFSPNVDEVEALVELVADGIDSQGEDVGSEILVDVVSTVEGRDSVVPGLERFYDYNRREADNFGDRARKIAKLELWIADAALRYARKMRHSNLKRVDWRTMRDAGGSAEVIFGRMQETVRHLTEADSDEVAGVFQALEPSHQQYRALLEATDRYRRFVDEGGWQRVRSFTVEEGETSDRVEALRDRLEAEGFPAWPEEFDEDAAGDEPEESERVGEESEEETEEAFDARVVDASLIEGVRLYQKTHQFEPDGDPTPGFWRSLNISAEDRLEQMELTLQRWRESHIEDDEDFIMVNIPDFHAEVWMEGAREKRFSVVVGRNQRRCDRDTNQWVYPDATPVVMSKMDHIMFNPPWYVPNRLVRETLAPRVAANPDYYEEEGYEEIELSDGSTAVRQLPGENNALGLVKFIFPNEHNVYLHDTPQKHYFDYNIRAYSHGCMRVSKPIELAKSLLEWKGRHDLDVDEILDGDRTIRIDFERELPVFVEYYTVWVDDDGFPNFLADIYQKDARRRAEDPDAFIECTPPRPQVSEEEDKEEEEIDEEESVPALEVGDDEEEPDDVDDDLGP